MKIETLTFNFHGELNRYPIKAQRLLAPSRLNHMRHQRIHAACFADAAQLKNNLRHPALIQVHALAGRHVVKVVTRATRLS
jgi:hypothetical protein